MVLWGKWKAPPQVRKQQGLGALLTPGLGDGRWGGRARADTWRKGCWKLCSLLPPQPGAVKLSAHL